MADATSLIFASPTMSPVTIRLLWRADGSRNQYGEWVPGDETNADVSAFVEPIDEATLALLGGTRITGALRFYVLGKHDDNIVDGHSQIRHEGRRYLVNRHRDWDEYLELLTALAERQDPEEEQGEPGD